MVGSRKAKSMQPERLEVHLEELGRSSWAATVLGRLTGSFGTARYRFIARPPSQDRDVVSVLGATFLVLRAHDLSDLQEPHAWLDIARARLDELDLQLRATGWMPRGSTGPHWWSRTYVRDPGSAT
jgi:hypothetical protein